MHGSQYGADVYLDISHAQLRLISLITYRRTKNKSLLDVIILQMLDSGLSGKLALVSEGFDWTLEFDNSLTTSRLESGLHLTAQS